MSRTAENFCERISSWTDLTVLVEHFSFFSGHDWLFRGVTDARHGLIPKIGREKTRGLKDGGRLPYRHADESAVFNMFKQQARPYLTSTPQSDLEWLSIAQHFGLPTRFLDWTEVLLAAAWFAAESGGAKKVDSAIWVTKGVPAVDSEDSSGPFNVGEAKVFRPPHISPRIGAQGSVLMICPKPTEELKLPFTKRIVIAREAQFTIKKRLNACGINRRHLFPDLGGLTDHLTWMYKNDWLAGYRAGK